ncbi:MAG: UDP-N-acetylmuramate--L-alanine ligase [bacterium]|nr:UDP-N-acetylmuramate--L-alanine ligase [bacterium]
MHRKKAKHIHFIGIKGVGMTPLAILAKEAKIRVTGSDIGEKFVTDEVLGRFGISWKIGFSPENIEGQPDLVVVTGAHDGLNNPEAQAAQKMGFKTVMQGEAVGIFMEGQFLGRKNLEGISVAGTHGKTTTTAMISDVLAKSDLDPSFVVGCGDIPTLGAPGHFGKGKYFVAEADEYATYPQADKTPKFLWQKPKIAVVTNIEYDHPDVFADIGEVKDAFLKFMKKVPSNGFILAGYDSTNVQELIGKAGCPFITFGLSPKSDWWIKKLKSGEGKTRFSVWRKSVEVGEFQLSIPGKFNALNALAAIIIGMELGIHPAKIQKTLASFGGTKRRFEFVGETGGVKLYDDYAHHPTEISATLAAAKSFFPGQKITCIFQPHTYSRTKALLLDFGRCFTDASEVLILDIYSSAREKSDFGVNAKILTQEIAKHHSKVKYLGKMERVIDYLGKTAGISGVIFTMGAGDIFLWHREILDALKDKHQDSLDKK